MEQKERDLRIRKGREYERLIFSLSLGMDFYQCSVL